MNNPWGLKFFDSGEWQVIEEHLADARVMHVRTVPIRRNLFRSLSLIRPDNVRVAFISQSPYGDADLATGLAFSVPKECREYPPLLTALYKEYSKDLHCPTPTTGNLEKWCDGGVLLWDSIPTARQGSSLAHQAWIEYDLLTQEVIQRVDQDRDGKVVFVFFGSHAKRFSKFVEKGTIIEVAYPTAGIGNKVSAFEGCRIFSTINAKLRELKLEPIDWVL